MDGVNFKFSRLEEDTGNLTVEDANMRGAGKSRTRKCVGILQWRAVSVALCLFCLSLIISYNRRDINYKGGDCQQIVIKFP